MIELIRHQRIRKCVKPNSCCKCYLELNGDVAKRTPAKRDRKATLTGQAIHPDAQHVLEDLIQGDNELLLEQIENEIKQQNEQIDLNRHEDGVGDDCI